MRYSIFCDFVFYTFCRKGYLGNTPFRRDPIFRHGVVVFSTRLKKERMMNETHPPRRVLRSIGAVLAGFLATFILSIATDLVLHAAGVFPPWGQPMSDALFVLATVYRTIYTVAGGYVTARLAPGRPMAHALALGIVGLFAAVAGTVATWNKGPEFGPKWYPLALVVLAIPCVLFGGKLAQHATARK
jgi:peptidoglycan/LPS O-acetylase OafA/YrhL